MSLYDERLQDRPRALRVGATAYVIEWFDNAVWRTLDSRGQCDTIYGIIRVYGEMAWSAQAETLAHEIMHAVINASAIPDSNGFEREQVCNLAQAFHAVLQENPQVRDWLTEAYHAMGDGRMQAGV